MKSKFFFPISENNVVNEIYLGVICWKTVVANYSLHTKINTEDNKETNPSVCSPFGSCHNIYNNQTCTVEHNCIQPVHLGDH